MIRFQPDPGYCLWDWATVTHTLSWIDLLETSSFNVRLFALPNAQPPSHWSVKTYVNNHDWFNSADPDSRVFLHELENFSQLEEPKSESWLAEIIRRWDPHIVHTFGLDPEEIFSRMFVVDSLKHEKQDGCSNLGGFPIWLCHI